MGLANLYLRRRLLLAILLVPTAALFLGCGRTTYPEGRSLTTEPTLGPGEASVAPDDKKPADQETKDEVSAEYELEYELKIAAVRLRIPEDEKLIAAQMDVMAVQTSQIRREEEQRKLRELGEKLEEDLKAINRLTWEEQEERDRRRAEADRQREAARAAQAEAECQRNEQAEKEEAERRRQAEHERQKAEQERREAEARANPVTMEKFNQIQREQALRAKIRQTRREVDDLTDKIARSISLEARTRRQVELRDLQRTLADYEEDLAELVKARESTERPAPKAGQTVTWADKITRSDMDGHLGLADLTVGAYGDPSEVNARVIKVIDEGKVLVGLEDRLGGDGSFQTWAMVRCSTKGLVDGKILGSLHQLLMPLQFAYVSGTTTYSTAPGSSRTVLVIDLLDPGAPYEPETEAAGEARGPVDEAAALRDKEGKLLAEQEERERKLLADQEEREAAARKQQEQEEQAARALKEAKALVEESRRERLEGSGREAARFSEKAKKRCQEIIENYPKTKAADEAKGLLDKLE
jgi:colicin import membrane protein